jgi:hypothetical protein
MPPGRLIPALPRQAAVRGTVGRRARVAQDRTAQGQLVRPGAGVPVGGGGDNQPGVQGPQGRLQEGERGRKCLSSGHEDTFQLRRRA